MNSIRNLILLIAVILPVTAVESFAERFVTTQYSKIVYNEKSKSYFQFVQHPLDKPKGWHHAKYLAGRLSHKGVPGRLAVVTDKAVSDFLRDTFKPPVDTWIGLRYFCKYRKSLWESGYQLDAAGYKNWAARWYRNSEHTCDNSPGDYPYMPVYYTAVSQGFRWQASGSAKEFHAYFVEFVTGKE